MTAGHDRIPDFPPGDRPMSLFSSLCASLVRPASFACPGLRAAAPLALSCAVLGALAPAAVQAQLRSDELRPVTVRA